MTDTDHLRELAERVDASKFDSGLDGWWAGRVMPLLDTIAALTAERDEWQQAGSDAMDRCRETHGKHFRLVGGMLGSGDGAVPSVPFHEQAICEPELAALRAENERLREVFEGAPHDRKCVTYDGYNCDCWKHDARIRLGERTIHAAPSPVPEPTEERG